MARRSRKNLLFPMGGLVKQGAYRQQKPYTTTDCLNVLPRENIEGRDRGGSRPGTMLSHIDGLGSEIRFLQPMTLLDTNGFASYSDTFSGTAIGGTGSDWTQATWGTIDDVPNILPTSLAVVDTTILEAAVTLDTLAIDISQTYQVEMLVVPYNGAHHGKYRIYIRMDDTTPVYTTEGVEIELVMEAADGSYTGTVKGYTGGVLDSTDNFTGTTIGSAKSAWLTVSVNGDAVSVYFDGVLVVDGVTVATHSATERGVGFGLECTTASGVSQIWVFRAQYFQSVNTLRSKLIASAGGNLYQENFYGRMTVVSSSLSVRSDVGLTVAQSGQKLYIADYGLRVNGTDGVTTTSPDTLDAASVSDWTAHGITPVDDVAVITGVGGATTAGTYAISSVASGALTLASDPGIGTCTFRIERAPKVFDPSDNSIVIMAATTGQTPAGCPLIARYLDRIFMAGAEDAPHAWFCSRAGDPLDWDYSQEDVRRAVLGTASEAGVPGEAVTALIAHSDDYLIIACRNELWRMRGDPAFGGSLNNLSRTVGIIGQNAWCLGPVGELIFLTLDGVYALAPGASTDPIPMSRGKLPEEFNNIDPNQMEILLEYDVKRQGVNIFLTSKSANTRKHWWIDWAGKGFWPVSLETTHEPTATCILQGIAVEDDGVILGGRDGYLRRFSHLSETDCGTAFSSYVLVGPISLASDMGEGAVVAMSGVLAIGSADVTWSLQPGSTFENCLTNSSQDTGTWTAGLSADSHPACRGQSTALLMTGESGRAWAFEQSTLAIKSSGRRRLA